VTRPGKSATRIAGSLPVGRQVGPADGGSLAPAISDRQLSVAAVTFSVLQQTPWKKYGISLWVLGVGFRVWNSLVKVVWHYLVTKIVSAAKKEEV
jgi:hypothetical protein